MSDITKIKVNGDLESSYKIFSKNREFEKRAKSQSDWNQNDSTQSDYLKNRPFYTGNPTEYVLFNGSFVFTIVMMGPIGERGVYNGVTDFSPEIGQTYQVSWDGAVYSCVGTEYNSLVALGNLSIMNFGSDTGEPFLMTCGTGSINIYTLPVGSSHTISISKMVAPVVKLKPKYIRDMYYTEMLETSIEGMEIANIPTNNEALNHNLPLEIGQVWSIGTELVDGKIIPPSHPDYINLEVQRAEDGTLYIGTYPDASRLPFCITPTSVKTNAQWIHSSNIAFLILFGVSGAIHEEVVHQIQIKYIPAFEGNSIILPSSTENSTKKFKITVDDSGNLTATEVT